MQHNTKYIDIYDKKIRKDVINNPKLYAEKFGYNLTDDIEVKVDKNTKNTIYFVISDNYIDDIGKISAGVSASTIGSAGSLGTFLTVPGASVSSLSTAGSVGTAGTNIDIGSLGINDALNSIKK